MNAAAPHIFTLTGNLLAERTLTFTAWAAGRTQRAAHETFQVGGKGINVAKMLNRLGAANTALCFAGGASGAECTAWLEARKFSWHAFPAATATRSGFVVRDATQPETTFLGPDVPPDASAILAAADYLDRQRDGQVLALCGSFPGWDDATFEPLHRALERWMRRGVLAADVYGPPLAWLATRPIALMKLNADELRSFAPDLARLPANAAAERWIVTDGPAAVQSRERDGSLARAMPPAVREVSATGSGDVFFAGVLHALFGRGMALGEAVSFALPYAAANAAHAGIAEFSEPPA